jgi:DNA-binding transcriptional LysR family regulator
MPARLSPGPFPSWDDYRYFLATSKAGSFTKAASDLGVTQSTLSRRIEHLEQQLGVRLFVRTQSGVSLTPEGQSILQAAREIEAKILEIQGSLIGADKRLEGTVRISVTDGLATFWIAPRLGSFHEENPGIAVELQCSIEPADALRMEAELSIQSEESESLELISVKLGTLHFVPWASRDYLKRHGEPHDTAELLRHQLLDHDIYHADKGDWSEWFGLARAANLISFKTNSSAALVSAIQNGAGIGLLPTYSCECIDGIVPLGLDLKTYSEIRLVYHPYLRETPRVRIVIDWLKGLFDQDAWPWFRDEFHPPVMRKRQKRARR